MQAVLKLASQLANLVVGDKPQYSSNTVEKQPQEMSAASQAATSENLNQSRRSSKTFDFDALSVSDMQYALDISDDSIV